MRCGKLAKDAERLLIGAKAQAWRRRGGEEMAGGV